MQITAPVAANTARDAVGAIDDRNYRRFPEVRAMVARHAPAALTKLYKAIAANARTACLLPDEEQRKRASNAQFDHWKAMFSGRFDDSAIARSEKIGRIHSQIGLSPAYYVTAYAMVLEEVICGYMSHKVVTPLNGRKVGETIASFVKTALYDMEAALGAYFDAESQARESVLAKMTGSLEKVAAGDLCAELKDLPPAYQPLSDSFHKMRFEISELIVQMVDSAESVKTGASEIGSAASDLANRTEMQASTTSRIAETMREVSSAMVNTASLSSDVSATVAAQADNARHGGQVMTEAVVAMGKIEQSSSEISSIIEVIDGIAFQTNLLALNAGVEAARAGEAGRGFAVVASEVRALAQRTTDSANLIKQLVANSSENVREGARLVNQMQGSLDEIIAGLSSTSQKTVEISEFSQSQAENMAKVTTQIQQMNLNTQQNAAMVEESNAAAHSLSDQAFKMASVIQRFKFERRAQPRDKRNPGSAADRRKPDDELAPPMKRAAFG